MSELVSNGVQIYQFPTDDETVSEINASMNVSRVETLSSVSPFTEDIVCHVLKSSVRLYCLDLHSTNM